MMSSEGWQFDEQGRLTPGTVRKMADEFPRLDVARTNVTDGVTFRELLTVGFIIAIVHSRAAAQTPARTG